MPDGGLPTVDRRSLLARAGLTFGAGFLAPPARAVVAAQPGDLDDWTTVRAQFTLTPDLIHMAGLYLASHPAPVREAIDEYRRGLDADPYGYERDHNTRLISETLIAAGDYLGVAPSEVALTGSTTMGLGLVYQGFHLLPGQEILTTTHDFYSTMESLNLRAARLPTQRRDVELYRDSATTSVDEIVGNLAAAIDDRTRLIAATWVHSSTGLKLPMPEIAAMLAEVNAERAEEDRIVLCLDGVHGLGVEDVELPELGCDIFVAGCHKWLFGPRGTGVIWARPEISPLIGATIPAFDIGLYADLPGASAGPSPAAFLSPGGFHAFEHRWALAEAFRFHQTIGKDRVAARIHALNGQLKEGLTAIAGVSVHTPMADELSAGIVCFDVDGLDSFDVVARLLDRRIVASVAPYASAYARLAPGLLNSPEDVDAAIVAVREIAGGR